MKTPTTHPPHERATRDGLPPPFDIEPSGHATVVLAHPDDELLVGGAIASLVGIGRSIDVLVLTDGERSTRGERRFVANGRRREESIAALEVYDIGVDHQHYLGLPDGGLAQAEVTATAVSGLAQVIKANRSRAVITTGTTGYDGHDDHKTAHGIAVAATRSLQDRYSASPAVWGLSERPGEETFYIDEELLYLKLAALSRHRSQFTLHGAEPFKAPGYVTIGRYDIHPESAAHLFRYKELLVQESYVRAVIPTPIAPEVGYTTSTERQLVS